MKKYGYARVSTDEQNLDLQLNALDGERCDLVFADKGVSGMTTRRPQYQEMMDTLKSGDTLVVWKLDRLGRRSHVLIELLASLRDRGIAFVSLTEGFDTTTPTGHAAISIMSVMAQLERDNLVERTKAGLAAARKRGSILGRRRSMGRDQISHARRMIGDGRMKKDVAMFFKVSRSTLDRALARSAIAAVG